MIRIEPADRPARRRARIVAACLAAALACVTGSAHASFLSGEALDTAADVMSWVVLIVVPIVVIVVFWLVHVLPEKIAHQRHHPQYKAIQCLCLLSLVFGGLLWPIAWLWAYTKPIGYKAAYGTDKADEYFAEMAEKARSGTALDDELVALEHQLDTMRARGPLPAHLEKLRADIAASRSTAGAAETARVVAEPEARSA